MNKFKSVTIFIGGVAVGGLTAAYLVKNKYEAILKEEIQSVKDSYKNKKEIPQSIIDRKEQQVTYDEDTLIENCDVEKVASTDDIKEFNEKRKDREKTNYGNYFGSVKIDDSDETNRFTDYIPEEENVTIPPHLIDEEEVGMNGFDMAVLTYYNDKILTNAQDEVIDIETYVGLDNIRMFDNDMGCQTMFIRNEHTGIDYEINRDDMDWADFADQMGIPK